MTNKECLVTLLKAASEIVSGDAEEQSRLVSGALNYLTQQAGPVIVQPKATPEKPKTPSNEPNTDLICLEMMNQVRKEKRSYIDPEFIHKICKKYKYRKPARNEQLFAFLEKKNIKFVHNGVRGIHSKYYLDRDNPKWPLEKTSQSP